MSEVQRGEDAGELSLSDFGISFYPLARQRRALPRSVTSRQSAVTMQMHQLEALVGLPLIERHGRRFTLTVAGREVFAAAERIEAVLADCTAGLAALKTLANGRVTVGVVSTSKYFAPQMLAAFARAHPGVEMELIIGNREDTIAAFQSGRFDVAIMGRPPEGVRVESARITPWPASALFGRERSPSKPSCCARSAPVRACWRKSFLPNMASSRASVWR